MPRLFIGIELPDELKQQLIKRQEGVPNARWQTAEQLHLTLNFIGDVEEVWANKIPGALLRLPRHPFEIALLGVGAFGAPGRPQVLWAGVVPAAPLAELHGLINTRLAALGLSPETREYTPHITLARLGKGNNRPSAFLQRHADLTSPPFPVTQVSLFQSSLTASGACYQVIGRFPLAG